MKAKRDKPGRPPGALNKRTLAIEEKLERLGCDPIAGLAMISARRVPCGTCINAKREPTGFTRVKLESGSHAEDCAKHQDKKCTCGGFTMRECQSCGGTLWEKIDVQTKLKADSELAQYVAPKRKAIEVSNPDGSLTPRYVIVRPKTTPPTPSSGEKDLH